MESLTVFERPSLRNAAMVMGLAGWPDAHEGATRAVRFLARQLRAKRCAELDPEEFYDFTQVRPITSVDDRGQRTVTWPANEFFYWQGESRTSPRDLLLFAGIEPHLKWKTYTRTVVSLAEQLGVTLVVHLGSLLGAVPHTREPLLSGSASDPDLRQRLEAMGIHGSSYQGPAGITTAIMAESAQRGLAYASVWGHSAHYLHVAHNPKVSHLLLQTLGRLLEVNVNLQRLHSLCAAFEEEVDKVILADAEARDYVRRLEQEYDAQNPSALAPPAQGPGLPEAADADALLHDLEEYLRQQRDKEQG